jgi:hypothetical protein
MPRGRTCAVRHHAGAQRDGTGQRFGVKRLLSPARATGRLIHTAIGKEYAACPHFAALLPCAALHASPPQLPLTSLAHAASARRTAAWCRCATVEASSAARAIGMVVLDVWRNGWEVLLGGSLCRLSVSVAGKSDDQRTSTMLSTPRADRPRCGASTSLVGALHPPTEQQSPPHCVPGSHLARCLRRAV